MGFFDRFSAKRQAPAQTPRPPEAAAEPAPAAPSGSVNAKAKLAAARERLEAKDLPGALAIYEEVLAGAGDRADVLVTISGDLGACGHVSEIVELIAPRYDANRHGPATGLNLLQAYLAVRNVDAAQHVLDILFSLERPELEERLYGFSNAIAEMMTSNVAPVGGPSPSQEGAPQGPKIGLITISKPVWSYGLETMAEQLLPPKEGKLRRIAFAQLAIPGFQNIEEAIAKPEDELGRLSRALPLWLAEAFYFSVNYSPVAAIGIVTPPGATAARPMIFGAEWATENLRQLVETTQGGLDYVIAGAIQVNAGDYEVVLRVYDVKSFRERKKFMARWTPATADAELAKLQSEVRRFMEWSPASAALAYVPPTAVRSWLETLGGSLGLFLVDKSILAKELLRPIEEDLAHAAKHAADNEFASLAYLTLQARAVKAGVAAPTGTTLARSALVQQAQQAAQ